MYRVCICDACGNRSLKEILGVNREDRGGGGGADNSTGRDKVAHTRFSVETHQRESRRVN